MMGNSFWEMIFGFLRRNRVDADLKDNTLFVWNLEFRIWNLEFVDENKHYSGAWGTAILREFCWYHAGSRSPQIQNKAINNPQKEFLIEDELSNSKEPKISAEGRDFIGGMDQLPLNIRILNLLTLLFFRNGFCVSYKESKDLEQTHKACLEGGWAGSGSNSSTNIVKRRTLVLTFYIG